LEALVIALIDMDLVVFRAAASAENENFGIAAYRAEETLDNILNKVGATEYKAYISSDTNFRKEIYPEYKAQRNKVKPIHLLKLKEYAFSMMGATLSPEGLEADDMLGIEQDKVGYTTNPPGLPIQYDTIICSLDKDLLQIPGKHFQWEIGTAKWNKPDNWLTQTELEGYRLFYEQAIKGDPTDNIKGLPGKGKVFATKALKDCTTEQEMFNVVRELYSNDEEYLLNAGCVWILRHLNETFAERFKTLANL
jgi:DNA polymerase-1